MNIAKVLLTISAVLVFARAFEAEVETKVIYDRWRNRIEQEHPECAKTWPITDDEREGYFRHGEVADTPTFKCYVHCVFKSFNLVNEDESVNRDEIYKMFERMTYQMVDFCGGRVLEKTHNCEKTFELVNCLLHYEKVYTL
ncbi:uncharacterized protein LOC116180055 [Photinus pyralis]|uniref:uncharacterized protein LOC116180055 n=1 Tax=Photinus pyralis TaxID=7054 RepID=UPI0012673892|nr:uncharacterized protein LOC116180055 [Photinus pyralis]